jgi:hypothetical protein
MIPTWLGDELLTDLSGVWSCSGGVVERIERTLGDGECEL